METEKMIIEEEQNQNQIKDITADELYNKFNEWNKDKESQMNKLGKKDKKLFYKLKDSLIKFNKMPTPFEGVELIDMKLGAKFGEDETFLEQDFIAEYMRRGESLFYDKKNNKYDFARFGLNKFFDYKKKFDEENENDVNMQKRVLGNMIKISNENENNKNVKYFAYLTTKVNGENFQVSYNSKYQCWVIASKNVSIAVKKRADINFYKNADNFLSHMESEEKEEKKEILNADELINKHKKKKKAEKKQKKNEREKKRKKGKDQNEIEKEDKEKEEKEKEKNEKNKKERIQGILNRFSYAIDFAETWFNVLEERIIKNNLYDEFIKELSDHTLIGESVGDKKREHILVYKERDIIFYGIVNNNKLLSQRCLPLSQSFNLFKKYNLSYTDIQPSEKYDLLTDLFSYINIQYDVIFDKSLQESGEGNVVYFSSEINSVENVQNLGKLKTFEYRFLRKIREKCKGVPPPIDKTKVEKELMTKINKKKNKKKEKNKKKDENKEQNEIKDVKEEINAKIFEKEMKEQQALREKKIENLKHKMKKESNDLLKDVPNSKYNTDKVLQKKYLDFSEYVLNYRAMDETPYNDVFASYIEIMKQKFEQKAEINELMINEIKKKFEGLINANKIGEDNEEEGNDEEDKKEEPKEEKEEEEDEKEE